MDDRVRTLRRRWWIAGVLSIVVPVALVVGLGHRGVHAARNLLVPGSGLYDHDNVVIGLAFTVAFIAATVAFVRWGADWVVVAVVAGAAVASAALATTGHSAPPPVAAASHEFPLVVLVVSALSWLRLALTRLGVRRPRSLPHQSGGLDALDALSPVERCQAVALAVIGCEASDPRRDPRLIAAATANDVRRRARRVGLIARGRCGGDPFRVDHAHARTALALLDRLGDAERERFVAEAERSLVGVPCSEPGWVRLLDATLTAVALARRGCRSAGQRWRLALAGPFQRKRSHRPAWLWTPLALPVAHAVPWEHAAAIGIAHAAGWCGDEDWSVLRKSALGAAARGAIRPADERLVAAARIWTALVDDEPARRILARPTVGRDPLASALDALATRLADDREWLAAIVAGTVEVRA